MKSHLTVRLLSASLFLGIFLSSSVVGRADGAPSARDRFAGVTQWRLFYHFSASSPYRWKDGPIERERTRWNATESGTILIKMHSLFGDTLAGDGEGPSTASLDRYFVEHTQYYSDSRYDRGSGPSTARARLSIDLKTGAYQLDITNGDITAQYGGRRMQVGGENRTWGPSEETTSTPLPFPLKPTPLPPEGRTLKGSCSWDEFVAEKAATDPAFDRHSWSMRSPASGKLTWVLVPDEPVEEELIVEVDDYDHWLPTAGKDEAANGSTVTIRAKVCAKDGGEPKQRAVLFRFALAEVSREPGIALNEPLANAKTTPDLVFEAGAAAEGGTVLDDGLTWLLATKPVATAKAQVASRDWGAFGVVNVSATLEDGRVLQGHFVGATDPDIRLPKRDPLSHIGDAWKQATHYTGSDEDDLDEQNGNSHEGDGLTAYEEYRGLIIQGRHTRDQGLLDPMKKDLVVENRIGAAAKGGIGLFESASGIHLIELAPDGLPKNRLVNINRHTASRGEQYGLRLKQGAVEDGVAENRPAKVSPKTPKLSEEIVVDVDQLKTSYAGQAAAAKKGGVAMPFSLADSVDNTIAHEIGHGVSAPHHGLQTKYDGKSVVTVKMRDWPVIASDGVRLVATETSPIELAGSIGRPGNDASGDTRCIMCYTNYYQWAAIGPEGGPYRFVKTAIEPQGKIFCTSAAPTGYNLPHKIGNAVSVPGFFGAAQPLPKMLMGGNCLGAMNVRDW